jgi:hypothetical protein
MLLSFSKSFTAPEKLHPSAAAQRNGAEKKPDTWLGLVIFGSPDMAPLGKRTCPEEFEGG